MKRKNNLKINEKLYVPINGQQQYILIRGTDENNPVILDLHGGPGGPDAYYTNALADEICDDYTLVSWDQRGSGRTYYKNKHIDPNNESASFDQALRDVDSLISYLCEQFRKEKIIIMGHSYGTLLGVSYVHANPEKVDKYVGIGQTVSILQTEEENYKEVLQMLVRANKKTDKLTKTFENFKQTLSAKDFKNFKMQTLKYLQMNRADIVQANQFKLLLSSPDFGWTDLRWILGSLNVEKHIARNLQLMDRVFSNNTNNVGKNFSVPMYFISGEYDVSCNVGLAKAYFESISAPDKEFVVMDKCGHNPQVDKPVEFAREMKRVLRK